MDREKTPAILELKDGTKIDIVVPGHIPRIISGWASELGIKAGKDKIIFAYHSNTIIRPIYRQENPEKFELEKR